MYAEVFFKDARTNNCLILEPYILQSLLGKFRMLLTMKETDINGDYNFLPVLLHTQIIAIVSPLLQFQVFRYWVMKELRCSSSV